MLSQRCIFLRRFAILPRDLITSAHVLAIAVTRAYVGPLDRWRHLADVEPGAEALGVGSTHGKGNAGQLMRGCPQGSFRRAAP